MPPSIPDLLAKNKTSYAGWCTLGSSYGVELVAAAGWDLVLIDQQHGFGGQAEMLAGLTAARAGDVPACVRVAWNDPALVSRALDAGAHGVVCPMINSCDDARAFVAAAKYPPVGARSWGPYRAQLLLDGDHLAKANAWAMTFAQIETAEALDNLDDILSVDGLDGVLVGPNDLAISMTGTRDIRNKKVVAAIRTIRKQAEAAGKATWIFAND
ncbi:MAG: HpcH/HpaI aldolase family protein, partial [Methyloligellaceae bacterium]